MSKVLVIAPHPDDEVLGCGGTIAKKAKAGDEIYLCVLTKAYTPDWSEDFIKNRPAEVARANKVLGIKKSYFLDFPTLKLDTIPQKEINDALSKLIKDLDPDIIFMPHPGDLNKDHRLAYECALVAVRPISKRQRKILAYEILSSSEWGHFVPFVPNVYEDVSNYLDKKKKAMCVYETEVKEAPHPRSLEMIEVLAKKRGSEAGVKFAEAFALVREVNV